MTKYLFLILWTLFLIAGLLGNLGPSITIIAAVAGWFTGAIVLVYLCLRLLEWICKETANCS